MRRAPFFLWSLLCGLDQNFLYVALLESAIPREKLHAIAIEGQMARRNHDGAIGLRLVENR